jgi:type I restriction enzyme R subunit
VISKKCEVIAKNFPFVLSSLNGEGKCMIVAPSVKSVLVYKQCLENLPEFKNQKIFVAFTGKVDGQTESSINGFSDEKTAIEFNKSENKILIVCNKFQTGFDQPKLTTLFVDQPLFGVHAVQTYSRLNRIRNNKETLIVDFVNTMNDIIQSFQPFFVPTVLDSSDFDQKEFEKVMQEIKSENFYTSEELERFNEILRMKYNKKDKLDENDDKEFVNILLQINNRIHNKQKYTDIQISDFEQRFKYLVKWYPIIYSIFKLKYDDEYRLFKCLEKSFPRPERG